MSYLMSKLLGGYPKGQADTFWINTTLFRTARSRTAHQALAALATMFYGRAHGEREIMRKGTRIYGETLPGLRADLTDPVEAFSFGTVASTTALSMYEVC